MTGMFRPNAWCMPSSYCPLRMPACSKAISHVSCMFSAHAYRPHGQHCWGLRFSAGGPGASEPHAATPAAATYGSGWEDTSGQLPASRQQRRLPHKKPWTHSLWPVRSRCRCWCRHRRCFSKQGHARGVKNERGRARSQQPPERGGWRHGCSPSHAAPPSPALSSCSGSSGSKASTPVPCAVPCQPCKCSRQYIWYRCGYCGYSCRGYCWRQGVSRGKPAPDSAALCHPHPCGIGTSSYCQSVCVNQGPEGC